MWIEWDVISLLQFPINQTFWYANFSFLVFAPMGSLEIGAARGQYKRVSNVFPECFLLLGCPGEKAAEFLYDTFYISMSLSFTFR